ncbi:rhomboid family intramembrane serine protease [bacterium]|nr:rhomboid family intramembrane serine protease [bacterium]
MQEYREYYREENSSASTGSWLPGVKWLLIANVLVYLAAFIASKVAGGWAVPEIYGALGFDPRLAISGRAWQVVTYAFLHDLADPFHMVVSLYLVWVAGRALEPAHGTRSFLQLYFLGVVAGAGACAATSFLLKEPLLAPMIGASVAAVTVAVAFLVENPEEQVPVFLLFDVRAWAGVAFMVAIDLVLVVHAGQRPLFVAACHLTGAALGLAWVRVSRAAPSREREPAEPRAFFESGEPRDELEEDLDLVLRKVHEQGMEKLTRDEKAILDRASRHYRNRK